MCARGAWMATRILTRECALVSTTATLSTATLSAATLSTAVNWPFSVLPLYAWGGGGGGGGRLGFRQGKGGGGGQRLKSPQATT